MSKPELKNCPVVLIVEGYSDLLFFAELLEHMGQHKGCFIKELNGKSDIRAQLKVFLTPEVLAEKIIGVIVDADSKLKDAAHSLTELLKEITGVELQHGEWKPIGNSTQGNIGFFVIGDQQGTGEIETVVWNAWANDPNNHAPKQCVEQFISCMQASGYKAQSPDKGRVSAILAICNDEDSRLGPGARTNCFDLNRPEYDELKAFLRGLAKQP
jgi:hypothetical protein